MATDDFDIRGVDYILNMIMDQNAQNTKDNNAFVQEIIRGVGAVKDETKLTNKAMDARTKAIIDYLKKYNAATDKLVEYIKEANSTLQDFKKSSGQSVSSDIYASAMTDVLGRAHQQSMYAAKQGGSPLIKYTSKSADIQKALRDVADSSLDKSTEKLIAFFQGAKEQEKDQKKKDSKNFISSFIYELGKSKLFGGTFLDFLKLVAYSFMSWTQQFGKPGKVIGLAIIGAVPVIASAIGAAVNRILSTWFLKLFTKLNIFSVLGGIAGGFGRLGRLGRVAKAGKLGLLGRVAGSKSGKVLGMLGGVKGLGPNLIGTAASLIVGGIAGKAEQDAIRDKKRGLAKTFDIAGKAAGASAIVGGAGTIAAAAGAGLSAMGATAAGGILAGLAAILGPIAIGIAAIAAAVTAIALIVKNWKNIKEFGRKALEKLGIIADKKGDKHGFFANLFGGKDDRPAEYISDKDWEKYNRANLKTNKEGLITNFNQVTQERGWEEIQRLRKENRKKFDQYYEIIDKKDPRAKHINFDTFQTDYRSPDGNQVLLGRGVLDNFIGMKKTLKGYYGHENGEWTDAQLAAMLITSGPASIGRFKGLVESPHVGGTSIRSHGSRYANVFDVSARSSVGGLSVKQLNESFYHDLENAKLLGKFEQRFLPSDRHDVHLGLKLSEMPGYVQSLSTKGGSIEVNTNTDREMEIKSAPEVKKSTKESKGDVEPLKVSQEVSGTSAPSVGERISFVEAASGNQLMSRVLLSPFQVSMFGGTDAMIG